MKFFRENTERLLFEKAKSLEVERNSWRCIFINFSEFSDDYDNVARTAIVTGVLQEILKNEDGNVYVCQDGDVFILFQSKLQPIQERLAHYFNGLKGDESDKLYAVLDLSKDWQVFCALCKAKASQFSTPPGNRVQEQTPPAPPPSSSFSEADAMLFRAAVARKDERKRPLVLLVEDDVFTRRLIKTTMKAECEVVEAGNGFEALRAYASHAPDAIFLDIELPDFSGHVILHKILSFDKSAFVVMLSAHSVKENILSTLEKGAQGFITKPFSKEKLVHYLRIITHQKQKELVLR